MEGAAGDPEGQEQDPGPGRDRPRGPVARPPTLLSEEAGAGTGATAGQGVAPGQGPTMAEGSQGLGTANHVIDHDQDPDPDHEGEEVTNTSYKNDKFCVCVLSLFYVTKCMNGHLLIDVSLVTSQNVWHLDISFTLITWHAL